MSQDSARLLATLEEYARLLVTDYSVSDALHDLVEGARDMLGIAGTGVSLAADDRLIFAIAQPDAITGLERVQEQHQTGPCVEAYRTGQRVVVPDIRAQRDRWPQLVEAAEQVGIEAAAGIPIRLNGTRLGALNLYDDTPRDWADEDLHAAEVLAAMAAGLIANAHRLDQARTTAEQLQKALNSRVVIEQAKGIIAAEAGIPIDDAFERLRTHARSHNLPLRSVAEAVVHLRLKL